MNSATNFLYRAVFFSTLLCAGCASAYDAPYLSEQSVKDAFSQQSVSLSSHDVSKLRSLIEQAQRDHCQFSPTGGNSKLKFAAVQTVRPRANITAAADFAVNVRKSRYVSPLSIS